MFCNDIIIIVIYVNDLFIAKFNKIDNRIIKIVFNKRFQMIDLNFLVYYLDINIQRNRQQRIFYFNQKIYLKFFFQNHEMTSFSQHVTSIKIICKLKIVLFNYVAIFEFKRKYQFAIKFLMYAMFETRSNIIYAISIVNRYVFNFILIYEKIVKRIFRYIQTILNLRFIFSNVIQLLFDYIDVD